MPTKSIWRDCEQVSCPKCEAGIGRRCVHVSGLWEGNALSSAHNERLQAFKEVALRAGALPKA